MGKLEAIVMLFSKNGVIFLEMAIPKKHYFPYLLWNLLILLYPKNVMLELF